MIEPKTMTERMMYCTARVVGHGTGGTKTGTGFFYAFPLGGDDARNAVMLVTNKHVIEGVWETRFVVHTSQSGGPKPEGQHTISANVKEWIGHPNPKVDLCALPVGGVLERVKAFCRPLDPSIIPSEVQLQELSAVEEILMIGYPNGLWDSINNYPIIRRGITASHPAVDFNVDGVATTVIDTACFPGSSGSPVLLHNFGTYADKQGATVIGSRTMFLGVLFAGPSMQTDGRIVIRNIPTAAEPIAQINVMINLGYIVKAKEVVDLGKFVLAERTSNTSAA